jgi:hypothetical protein
MGTFNAQADLITVASTDLNALNATAYVATSAPVSLGGEPLLADFELAVTFGGNPTAGGTVDLYAIPSYDGTNYVDGDAATVPQSALLLGSFVVRAATAHRLALIGVRLPNCHALKFCVRNNTSQNFPATGSTLKMQPYLVAG